MKRIMGKRGVAAVVLSVAALMAFGAAPVGASAPGVKTVTNAIARTFSFIGKPGGRAVGIVNINGFQMNARCSSSGNPVIFAFSLASKADLLGRIFDGLGRLHSVHNTSFNHGTNKGVSLSTTSGDFDASGAVLFEDSNGNNVSVNYAFDNATTLSHQNVCTVYGSLIAS